MRTKKLRKVMRKLREHAPTDLPVRVVRRAMSKRKEQHLGYCLRGARAYRIVLNSNLSHELQLEMLLHEYAHAVAWKQQDAAGTLEQHDTIWSAAYGRTFRAFYGRTPYE